MDMTDRHTYSVRLFPPLMTALAISVMMSSPVCEFSLGGLIVVGLLQLSVSYISLWVYSRLCRRVHRRKWLTLFLPFSLLVIPLPMYGVLYGVAEWSAWPILRIVGGDGVFGMISWGFQLALVAYGMVYSGNALLKNAPLFPQSHAVSLLSGLAGLLFASIFFLPGIFSTLVEGHLDWLPLTVPPCLLFLLPPSVFFLVFGGESPAQRAARSKAEHSA